MIVVTATTSGIGRQVLANILDEGQRVCVVARDPARLSARTGERVEVIEGAHSQREVVTLAFERGGNRQTAPTATAPHSDSTEAV